MHQIREFQNLWRKTGRNKGGTDKSTLKIGDFNTSLSKSVGQPGK